MGQSWQVVAFQALAVSTLPDAGCVVQKLVQTGFRV